MDGQAYAFVRGKTCSVMQTSRPWAKTSTEALSTNTCSFNAPSCSGARALSIDLNDAVMKKKVRNPVVHFEVLGRDAGALQKFYSEAFGWQLGPADDGPMEYSMVHMKQGGGIDGGIGKAPQGPGHVTFYVGVDDAQAALEQVERLGGQDDPAADPRSPAESHSRCTQTRRAMWSDSSKSDGAEESSDSA